MEKRFEQFVRERRFFKGVSPKTVAWYEHSWKAFQAALTGMDQATLNKGRFMNEIEAMQSRGVSNTTINTYLRCINAFLHWCHVEGHLSSLVRLPRLKEIQKVVTVWSLDEVRKLSACRPDGFAEERARAIALLILDTGIRISEALNLTVADIDFDALMLTVRKGKGGKQRIVPISPQGRRVIRAYTKAYPTSSGILFSSANGGVSEVHNVRSDFARLCKRIGITHDRGGWHVLRHSFATHFIRNQGNVISLQRILGHSSLEMTQRYVAMNVADIQVAHARHSIFSSIRG